MAKINLHIEIVSSTATGLSSMSKVSRDAACNVLSRYYTNVGISIINNQSDLKKLAHKAPDLVFLGMKFLPENPSLGSEDPHKIWLTEYLLNHGIAVTGSTASAHVLEQNKPLSKKCLLRAGLNTSSYYVAKSNQPIDESLLPGDYPLFVKPANRGGGAGIDADSVVRNFSQLKAKVASVATKLDSDSLIERYLPGREFSVAILKNTDGAGFLVMPIELIAPKDENGARILGSKTKLADTEKVVGMLHDDVRVSVTELALKAFHSIGGRDYGRIDIRMDEQGVPHFLEANLIPSLIDKYGSFPKACALNMGIGYEEMMLRIVNLGLSRTKSFSQSVLPEFESAATLLPAYS